MLIWFDQQNCNKNQRKKRRLAIFTLIWAISCKLIQRHFLWQQLESTFDDSSLFLQMRKQMSAFFERRFGGSHFGRLNAVGGSFRQTFATEINGHRVLASVGRPLGFQHSIMRNIRFTAIRFAKRQTALLQLRFGIVPFLAHDEMLKIS